MRRAWATKKNCKSRLVVGLPHEQNLVDLMGQCTNWDKVMDRQRLRRTGSEQEEGCHTLVSRSSRKKVKMCLL